METGRRSVLNTVQLLPGVKHAYTHTGYAEKLPLTLKNSKKKTKKTVRPPAAGVITNCAFMPTDADTVNIHVQDWMGPAEAWMRGTDGRFQPIYKKCIRPTFNTDKGCWSNQNSSITSSREKQPQPYSLIRAQCLTVSDTPALSEIQVRHCYSCPPWRVEGVVPYVNI